MCVEINLNNYSADACTFKYVHAVQNYIVHIRNDFYIIERSIYASTRGRERERERERGDDSKLKYSSPFPSLLHNYDTDNLNL